MHKQEKNGWNFVNKLENKCMFLNHISEIILFGKILKTKYDFSS